MADALSRHPLDGDYKSDTDGQVRAYVNTMVASKPIMSPKLEEIHRATQDDAVLQKERVATENGTVLTPARISHSQSSPF